jgi:signal transduction histidine kinase
MQAERGEEWVEGVVPTSDELLAEVAHDLRGYLTVIKGYAQLVEADAFPEPETLREVSRRISRTCSLMTELLETCLDLELTGHSSTASQLIDPAAVLRECISFHGAAARSKAILVQARMSALPHLLLDGASLRRIVGNLLANAIKYTPCGRQVSLHARVARSSLVVEVEDEGPGLARQEIPAIFRRRQRGSTKPTAGERSDGLGLAIVRRLVHTLHGEVRVHARPGGGTVFAVILPVTRIAA